MIVKIQEKMTMQGSIKSKTPIVKWAFKNKALKGCLLKAEHRAIQWAITLRHISLHHGAGMIRSLVKALLNTRRTVRFPEHFRQTHQ